MELESRHVAKLEWDSQFFKYPVGRIEAPNLSAKELSLILDASRNDFDLLYWFVDSNDELSNAAALENSGFLVDKKTTYLTMVREADGKISSEIQSYLNMPLSTQLRFLSLEAGWLSRYRVDPNFVNSEFERLYTEWIVKSLTGEMAKEVLVYIDNKIEAGFITLGEKNNQLNISLIAVDPSFRGKQIGTKLVEASFKKAVEWGYKEVNVVTQGDNVAACKFYEKLGFKVNSVVNVYHFWPKTS